MVAPAVPTPPSRWRCPAPPARSQRATAWATNTWRARCWPRRWSGGRKAKKDQYPAPYALISTWQRSGGKPIQARLDAERRAVVKLASTPTARNLIRIFFLTERLKGLGGGDSGIRHVHVVGAGVMGGDIAAWPPNRAST